MKTEFTQRKIFDPEGDDSMESRKLIGGFPTGIANTNSVKYKWATSLYKIMLGNFWIPEKVPLVDDRVTIKELTPDEMTAFKNTLSFLIALDSMQTANLPHLANYITAPEVKKLFTLQALQETIHSDSYQYILQELFPNLDREEIYNYWRTNEKLLKRNTYIASLYEKFNQDKSLRNFKIALAADFALEGIYFYNGFNFFYQLASRNKAVNVAKIIKYIENDEVCLIPGTEVLTSNGWRVIEEITLNDVVCQYDVSNKKMSFVNPTKIINKNTQEVYSFVGDNISQHVTGNHRMVISDSVNESISIVEAKDVADIALEFNYVLSGDKLGSITTLSDEHKKMIDETKLGNIDLFTWIQPILVDIDSQWAKEFLTYWSR